MAGGTAGNKASEIGSRIKHRREELNLSQLELGIRAETSPRAIYGYEKGEHLPRKDTLQRLADALDTTVAALCGKSVTSDEDLHQLTSKEKDFVLRLRQLEGDTRINAENAIDSILTALLSVQNGRRKKVDYIAKRKNKNSSNTERQAKDQLYYCYFYCSKYSWITNHKVLSTLFATLINDK